MASTLIALAPPPAPPPSSPGLHPSPKTRARLPISFQGARLSPMRLGTGRRRRGEAAVVQAGGGLPSSNTLILAFFLPLSLLVGTILASIRIADSLDERYLEDLAMNKAVMEEMGLEAEEEGEDGYEELEEEEAAAAGEALPVPAAATAAPRTRNRPRRQA